MDFWHVLTGAGGLIVGILVTLVAGRRADVDVSIRPHDEHPDRTDDP